MLYPEPETGERVLSELAHYERDRSWLPRRFPAHRWLIPTAPLATTSEAGGGSSCSAVGKLADGIAVPVVRDPYILRRVDGERVGEIETALLNCPIAAPEALSLVTVLLPFAVNTLPSRSRARA